MKLGIKRRVSWGAVALGPLLACGDPPRGDQDVTGNPTTSATVGEVTVAPTSTDAIDDTGAIPDIGVDDGMMTAGDAGDADGCDKVDFLFIVDNSGSMGDEQQNLIASFPQFIDTIQSTLDKAQDYHVMVLDSDAWVYESCPTFCETPPPPECAGPNGECDPNASLPCLVLCAVSNPCVIDGSFECGVTQPLPCEDILGAGVVHPRGAMASNVDCNFASGQRFMDSTEPDLAAAFTCAAQVGTGSWGGTERPMEAMVQGVTAKTAADTCNEGFIRDDAILVVTYITDEDDNGDSSGNPAGWKQALVAAKNGQEDAIVVLGLFGDNDQPGGICSDPGDGGDGAEASPRLREFVDSFGDKGFFGSVCAPSYDAFFAEAVGLIDTTCEEFIPPEG